MADGTVGARRPRRGPRPRARPGIRAGLEDGPRDLDPPGARPRTDDGGRRAPAGPRRHCRPDLASGPTPGPVAASAGGAAAPLAAPWFRVGTAKLLLMCVVTFGLYEIYWFYQQWRHVQRRGERVHPAPAHAVRRPLLLRAVPPRLGRTRRSAASPRAPSAIGCAVVDPPWLPSRWRITVAAAATRGRPLSLLQLLPLALVQRAASAAALAAVPGADPNTRLTPINWVGIAFGVMILLLTALASDASRRRRRPSRLRRRPRRPRADVDRSRRPDNQVSAN